MRRIVLFPLVLVVFLALGLTGPIVVRGSDATSSPPATPVSTTITFGSWDIIVVGVSTSTDIGRGTNEHHPRGIYLVVHLLVTNTAKQPADFPYGDFILTTADGYQYSLDNDGTWSQVAFNESKGDYSSYDSTFQPLLEYPTAVVFDIPAKHADLTLTTSNGDFSVALTAFLLPSSADGLPASPPASPVAYVGQSSAVRLSVTCSVSQPIKYLRPDPGNEWIVCTVAATNLKDAQQFLDDHDFSLIVSSGESYIETQLPFIEQTPTIAPPILVTELSLSSHQTDSLRIGFEIPEKARLPYKIVFHPLPIDGRGYLDVTVVVSSVG